MKELRVKIGGGAYLFLIILSLYSIITSLSVIASYPTDEYTFIPENINSNISYFQNIAQFPTLSSIQNINPISSIYPISSRYSISNLYSASWKGSNIKPQFMKDKKLSDGINFLFDKQGNTLPDNILTPLAKQLNLNYENEKVRVIIHLNGSEDEYNNLQEGSKTIIGGVELDLERKVGNQLQVFVEVDNLSKLVKDNKVRVITVPELVNLQEVISEGVNIIGADELHNSGIKGQGITIGILDGGFKGYAALLGTELPNSVTTKSFYPGGDIEGGGSDHGTAVAEIVHDVAPEANLVLVNMQTNLDFISAIDWLINQSVDVITTSTGFINSEPLDGTGSIARKANSARDSGIIFDASAGNSGEKHHYKIFTPHPNLPSSHNFGTSNVGVMPYIIPAGTPITIYLAWDDWGDNPDIPTSSQDYDLYLYRYNYYGSKSWTGVAASYSLQDGNGFPRETIMITAPTTDLYGIVIEEYDVTSHSMLNLFTSVSLDSSIQNPERSLVSPCVGEKVLCVGATNLSDDIEAFSSRGPSIPNENTGIQLNKPDLSAPNRVSGATKGPKGFAGTSASAPHVGGAAALYLQMTNGDYTKAENQLIADTLDLGLQGYDTIFGHGRLRLNMGGIGTLLFRVNLTKGWNLFSSPLNFTNITKIFNPIQPHFISMFSYKGEDQKFNEIDPFNPSQDIDLRYGALVEVSKNVTLNISGKEFGVVNPPLFQKWNLIGHPYLNEKNVFELFPNNSVYSYNGTWSSYIPGKQYNSLQLLKPGYSYWVKQTG